MSRLCRLGRARHALPFALVAAALVLGGCTTTAAPTVEHLDGTPATSISVPLTTVGCTLNDVCVAVGSRSTSVGPTAVGEFASPHGNWFDLTLPAITSPLITSMACSGTQCLIGGSQPGLDLLWQFTTIGNTVTAVTPPTGGIGVDALSCDGLECVLVDTASAGDTPRLSVSNDAGTSWSAPVAVPWAHGDAISSLACEGADDCLVSARTSNNTVALESTNDGGTTWLALATPRNWTTLSSITCDKRQCVALARTASSSLLERSRNFASSWSSTRLSESATSLACTTLATCVVSGASTTGAAWLARVVHDTVTNVVLRYVPTTLEGAACGSKVCAAIGVTTLLSTAKITRR